MVTKYPCFTLYSATRNLRGFFICFLFFSLKNASWYNKPCFCLLFFFVCDAFLCFFLCFFECPFGFSRCYWNTQFSICLAGLNFSDLVCLFWMGIGWPFNLLFFSNKGIIVVNCVPLSAVWLFLSLWAYVNLLAWFDMTGLILPLCTYPHCFWELSFCGFLSKYFWRFFCVVENSVSLHWSVALEECNVSMEWIRWDHLLFFGHFFLNMAISYFFSGIFFDQFVFDCNFALSLDPHHVLNW